MLMPVYLVVALTYPWLGDFTLGFLNLATTRWDDVDSTALEAYHRQHRGLNLCLLCLGFRYKSGKRSGI